MSEEILRRLRDEPNWNPSFGPGGLSRQEAKVWHQTCVLAANEIERLSAEVRNLHAVAKPIAMVLAFDQTPRGGGLDYNVLCQFRDTFVSGRQEQNDG